MAVQGDAERARHELLAHQGAQRLAFPLHGRLRLATVPRQAWSEALAAEEEGHALARLHGSIAHKVDAVGVGAAAAAHTRRIDQWQKYEPQPGYDRLHPLVPLEAAGERIEEGKQHLRADAFEAVHPAEKPHGRCFARATPQSHGIEREGALAVINLA